MPNTDRPSSSIPDTPAPSSDDAWTFRGFTSPNTTAVPDEFFDELAPRLREAELRVCLYVMRRTFGWKKSSDDISLRQMVEGIKTKDGRQLDHGTGMSKPAVTKAVTSLVERRVLIKGRNRSVEKGDMATTYALNVNLGVAPSPLVLISLTRGGKPSELGGVNEVNPQHTGRQETEIQQHAAAEPSASKLDPEPPSSDVVDLRLDRQERVSTALKAPEPEGPDQLKERLIKRGVATSTAAALVRDIRPQLIREKLALFDWAKQHRPGLITRSDGGWLRTAIETNYPLPADFIAAGERDHQRQQAAERKAREQTEEMEQKAKEMAEPPVAVAERRLRVKDRLDDARRRPRLAGEEREHFRRTQEAQHADVAAAWFTENPSCAHLMPDWLTSNKGQ